LSDHDYTPIHEPRRTRPSRRVAAPRQEVPPVLTEEFIGKAVAYGNTLLFIGYEVNSRVEIVVYPRYRFSSDDRVKGYLGYLWVHLGTLWDSILGEVDEIYATAQENYRSAATTRSSAWPSAPMGNCWRPPRGSGGKAIMPVTNVTEGVTIAMFTDPSGNVVGLLKGL
jgi:hypothetical protein